MAPSTRRQRLTHGEAERSRQSTLVENVFMSTDIVRILLPSLSFPSFVALRGTARDIRKTVQEACVELMHILQRAAELYVSPNFADALALVERHQPHLCWLLQTPALAVVAPDSYDEIIASAYHLLQAHLTRLQKLAVSVVLRRAASCTRNAKSKFILLHLGVRLGMFTESTQQLRLLHEAAMQAVDGIRRHYGEGAEESPAIAAAHYTLAGFYTYHHRRKSELGDALEKAQRHLQQALNIQTRHLGSLHVSTLCSQLVKAQVMLMQDNALGCGKLLQRQLQFCERSLGSQHPLAAKMLAVMARLQLKLGKEEECELLQQRVLQMRQAALGLHHEDTHRSAMDVYSRRRQVVVRAPNNQAYEAMAQAMATCFEMLQRASLEEGGTQGFCLSKSLQGMADHVFKDLLVLAKRGTWSRERTLPMLEEAAKTVERLPCMPPDHFSAELEQAALVANAAGALIFNSIGGNPVIMQTSAVQEWRNQHTPYRCAEKLRNLIEELKESSTWPPSLGS
ncbi:hypothetical protein AB1Y20_011371 [Prymnesium parvum]|uniref:Uncharacterized protein n=1 Tax=Prymnesium parvum TaxID=97485 RepID=A0AB34IPI5_PRYPA|mmetsp:Transcript_33874/g.84413  ORF Transcript_33874/g.84413 Transcript_33874/m.84413 type:complete len:510 (+) Transcript_33874:388-1917(+)